MDEAEKEMCLFWLVVKKDATDTHTHLIHLLARYVIKLLTSSANKPAQAKPSQIPRYRAHAKIKPGRYTSPLTYLTLIKYYTLVPPWV